MIKLSDVREAAKYVGAALAAMAIVLMVSIAGGLYAKSAFAADVLEFRGEGATMFLTDEPCPPEVKKLIRPEWQHALRGGRVEVTDVDTVKQLGRKTYAVCWSEVQGRIAFMDEFGFSLAVPKRIFNEPGKRDGQDKL